jgi:phage terminase small subunit
MLRKPYKTLRPETLVLRELPSLQQLRELASRQLRFVHEYAVDWNATAAYKRAAYKATGHAAEVNASRLLKRAHVAAAVSIRLEQQLKQNCVRFRWLRATKAYRQ